MDLYRPDKLHLLRPDTRAACNIAHAAGGQRTVKRSLVFNKKNKGYGKKAYYTIKKLSHVNSKGLKKGKTYYYKVRAFKIIDGAKVYTPYSTKSWRKIK